MDRKSVPGVETHATAFLNLARGEWLKRPAWWIEALGLASIAVVLGYAFALCVPGRRGLAVGAVILTALLAVAFFLSCYVWFPWLDVAVVQVPVAWTSSVLFHFVQLHTQKRLLEQSLSLHLAPARVEQLLRQPELRRREAANCSSAFYLATLPGSRVSRAGCTLMTWHAS